MTTTGSTTLTLMFNFKDNPVEGEVLFYHINPIDNSTIVAVYEKGGK